MELLIWLSEKHLQRYVELVATKRNILDTDIIDQMCAVVPVIFGRSITYWQLSGSRNRFDTPAAAGRGLAKPVIPGLKLPPRTPPSEV